MKAKPVLVKLALLLIVSASLQACSQPPREHRETLLVFGTLVEITLYDLDEKKATEVISGIREDLNAMNFMWHPWEPGPLGRTNELLAMTRWFSGNPSVMPLIERSRKLAKQSHNLYNPAIGKLIALWGYHSNKGLASRPPPAEEIRKLVEANPQISDIVVDGIRMKSNNPAVQLDFGAMAKGLAIDREIDFIKSQGVKNAIINAGGDLKAIGKHGDRPWRIGIRHPRKDGVIAALNVNDGESVFTSGDYERFFEYQGKRYHHILDPRTGYPADQSISVTVIHPDAATADAAATAIFVAGPQQWQQIAKDMGIRYVMLIDKDNTVHITRAMNARIEFTEPPEKIRIY